jgi:hypothetical protein
MHTLPLQFRDGHLFVELGGELWLPDTGFEENQVLRRQVGNADPAGLQAFRMTASPPATA